jgi:cytochrome c oxidase cbb3-type subunit 3
MNQFYSPGWAFWIGGVTIVSIVALFFFLRGTARQTVFRDKAGNPIATTGHVWDGDLQEFNNPLPRWWMGLFILTLIFAVIYLSLYGGLAFYKGILGYSSDKMYQQESAAFDARIEPLYAAYMKTPIPELAANPTAMATGQRMFLTYCSQCHGSDAGGTKGFPNLTIHNANAWLYGNSPEVLVETIANGRLGMMPPMEAAIGGKPGVLAVANYVRSLSGMKHDAQLAAQGKPLFATACAACHAADGTGNKALGAPDLADPKRQWLFGSSIETISHTIEKGRAGQMPAQKDFLSPEKIHLLAAYVYSISHGAEAAK